MDECDRRIPIEPRSKSKVTSLPLRYADTLTRRRGDCDRRQSQARAAPRPTSACADACKADLEMFRALLKGRFQRLNWVPFRDELMRDVPGVPGFFDGP
jgi:hypothetical protein